MSSQKEMYMTPVLAFCIFILVLTILIFIAIDRVEGRDKQMYTLYEGLCVLYKDLKNKINNR